MVVISQDFLDVYARVGKFIKYHETVAALLASTDTYEEGEIVMAGPYYYEGAASGATDHHITNAGGAKLYCLATPYVTPDQFGAPSGTDDTADECNAAIASGLPVFLNRLYHVSSTVKFPAGMDGITIIGGPLGSNFNGIQMTGFYGKSSSIEAVLETFTQGDDTVTGGHYLSSFYIGGQAKRGLVIGQVNGIQCDNLNPGININSSTTDVCSVLIEEATGVLMRGGQFFAGPTTDMKIGRGVSSLTVDLFYSNNTTAHQHVDIHASRVERATSANGLNGPINFLTPAFQGARGYGIKVLGQAQVNCYNVYMENTGGTIFVKSAGSVNFHDGEIGTSWIDQTEDEETSQVNFFGTVCNSNIYTGDVRSITVTGGGITLDRFRKTNATYKTKTAMPTTGSTATQIVNSGEYITNGGSQIAMKCSSGSQFSRLTVDSSGVVTGTTPFDLTDAAVNPLTTICWWPDAGNPTWASGGAITPVTVGCVGGSGTYTFTIVGGSLPANVTINSSTGQLTGTPTTPGTYSFRVRATDTTASRNYWDETRLITATVT